MTIDSFPFVLGGRRCSALGHRTGSVSMLTSAGPLLGSEVSVTYHMTPAEARAMAAALEAAATFAENVLATGLGESAVADVAPAPAAIEVAS